MDGIGVVVTAILAVAAVLWNATGVPTAAHALGLTSIWTTPILGNAHLAADLLAVAACLLRIRRMSGAGFGDRFPGDR